jgi:hypothetical protein
MKRDPLALTAVLLAGVAFAGSFSHVQEQVASHGQVGWLSYAIASMPEISVVLAVLRIRRALASGQRDLWAWIVGGTAAGFTLAANLAVSEHTVWGWLAGGWPAWTAIGAAFLIKMAPGQAVKPQVRAPMSAKAKPPATPPTGIPAPDVTAVVRPAHVRTDTKPKRTPDNATKTLALHAVRTQPGRTQDDIAREFGVTARTLRRWITEAEHADQEVAA